MRRALVTVTAAATITFLAACSNNSQDEKAAGATLPTATSAAPSSSEPTGPARSDRGNIVKALGEEGGVASPENPDQSAFTFSVDAIRVDAPCNTGFDDPPANGHYIGIDVRAATTAELPAEWFIQMTADNFKVIGPDGLTKDSLNGNAWSCLDAAQSFTTDILGPGQQYAGTVIIDSPVTSGTLVYTPGGETTGWEWEF